MYRKVSAARRGEAGFTFVEVLVIAIIIAILAAIAITTLLVQRERAHRSAAISALRNTATFAESIRHDEERYADHPGAYQAESPAYLFVGASQPSADSNSVSVWASEDGDVAAFAVRGGATCYYLRLDDQGRLRVTHRERIGDASCRADEFTSGDGDGW